MTVSYSEESQKLLNMRNEGAMLSDPTVREGYVQGAVARGLEAAGSNSNGSMAGFMGMGMASNISGGMMGAASNVNLQQMQMMRRHSPLLQSTKKHMGIHRTSSQQTLTMQSTLSKQRQSRQA